MKLPFVDLKAQFNSLEDSIRSRLDAVFEHGQFIMGPEVEALEKKLESFSGAKHCITVSSGTEALLISLMALEVGPGDEVITTSFTFVSTVEVIALLGATPIFVDIDPETCCIDAAQLESAITENTKVILPVSLYGQPADMEEINTIAERHSGIVVIEDAAQSFGSMYKANKSCNLSKIGCTSFFPSKPLGCYGDGGAIFTSDDQIAEACRQIRVHGQSERYVHTRLGVGGRMDTIQCAVVLAKLEKFDWEIARRIEIGRQYNAVMDEAGIPRVYQKQDRTSVFAQYAIFVKQRNDVQNRLRSLGIPTSVHYPVPLNEQPAYRYLGQSNSTPISRKNADMVLCLPMHPYIDSDDLKMICTALKKAL